jgi:hypothetical protein
MWFCTQGGAKMIVMDYKKTNITNTPYDNPHIRRILDKEIDRMMWRTDGNGLAVDGFARESFVCDLDCFITNDLNPIFKTDYNLEWKDFAKQVQLGGHKPDLVFFDPPYSLRQLKEHYDGIGKDLELWQTHNMWKEGKDIIASCMPVGGRVVSLGWTTAGFGAKRGFDKVAIYVFEQAAREDRYSLLVTIEQKVQHSLLDYPAGSIS